MSSIQQIQFATGGGLPLKVILGLHMNGPVVFDDTAGSTLTQVGGVSISTTLPKFGVASGLFNGTTGYLQVPYSEKMSIGTGDFTIEGWSRQGTANAGAIFATWLSGVAGSCGLTLSYFGTPGAHFWWYTGGGYDRLFFAINLFDNQWHHLAVSRQSGTLRLFVDGAVVATRASHAISLVPATSNIYVGYDYSTGGFVNGNLDDVCVSTGQAKYSATFAVPTGEFA